MENKIKCRFCGSEETKKDAKRKTKFRGEIQRYKCKKCGKRFIQKDAFFRMRNPSNKITLCMDLYYKGVSLRKIQEHLQVFYPRNSHYATIYRWLMKYISIMQNFTDKQQIQSGKYLQGDEVEYHRRSDHTKGSKGIDKDYYIDVIDTSTRYLVSGDYCADREYPRMRKVYDKAKYRVGNAVEVVSTDGLMVYPKVLKKTFGLRLYHAGHIAKTSKIVHKITKSDSGKFNYKIERFHNTLRERTKVMRGFHGDLESARIIMKGFEIYYNFIRKHLAIDGTPQQKAIPTFEFTDKNKWLELINLGYDN